MENKDRKIDEIVTSSQKEGTQKSPESGGRINIDDINRRNEVYKMDKSL